MSWYDNLLLYSNLQYFSGSQVQSVSVIVTKCLLWHLLSTIEVRDGNLYCKIIRYCDNFLWSQHCHDNRKWLYCTEMAKTRVSAAPLRTSRISFHPRIVVCAASPPPRWCRTRSRWELGWPSQTWVGCSKDLESTSTSSTIWGIP